MKRKKILAGILSCVMIAAMAGCGGTGPAATSKAAAGTTGAETSAKDTGSAPAASDGEKMVFTITHIGAEDHQYNLACEKINELLQEKTSGRISVQIFPNAQLGAEREIVEGIIMGSIDMGIVTMDGVVPSWVPDTSVMSIPYLFENKEQAYDALDHYIGPKLAPAYEAAGIKCLGFVELGFRHFTNNKKPVHTAEDMEGLIIRVQESPVWFGLCDAVGAVATPVAINELYTALQQGVVDGQENPLGTIVTSKFYEVQDYLTLDGHTYGAGSIFMNLNKWNSLSAEDQAIFQECVEQVIPKQRALVDQMETEWLQTLVDSGIQVDESPDRETFVKATAGMEEKSDIAALFDDVSIVQGVRDYLAKK